MELNQVCTVTKKMEINGFEVLVSMRVLKSFKGKEMMMVKEKKIKIGNYFIPFDKWLANSTG